MGTRSTTVVYSDNEKKIPIVKMYLQFDGYLDGHGQDLLDFLKGKKLCHGFSTSMTLETHWNGMECCAAALVKHFKGGIGTCYLIPLDAGDEEYNYELFPDVEDKRVLITCKEEPEFAQDLLTQMELVVSKKKKKE